MAAVNTAILVAIGCLCGLREASAQPAAIDPIAQEGVLRAFLLNSYPELASYAVEIFTGTDIPWLVGARAFPSGVVPPPVTPHLPDEDGTIPLVVSAHVPSDEIESYSAHGLLLHTREQRELEKLDEAGQVQTLIQLKTALTRLGARFGPDDRVKFERALDRQALERSLGVTYVSYAEFIWDPDFSNHDVPEWQVIATAPRSGGHTTCFVLSYDVFGGRLQGFTAVTKSMTCGGQRVVR